MNRKWFAVLMAVAVGSVVFTGCSSTSNTSVPEKVVENTTTDANETTGANGTTNANEIADANGTTNANEIADADGTTNVNEIADADGTTNVNDTTSDVNEEGVYGEVDPSPSQELYYVLTDGLELPASMNMDPAILKDTYEIDADTLASYVAYMPLANVIATEISIFELNEGISAEEVKTGIQKRVDSLLEQWERYLPAQYELVQNHKIVEKDNYILFVVSEYADTIVERFEAAASH